MPEDNKALARRWFEQVWNQKDEAVIDELFSPHGKSYGFPDADSVIAGPEAFKSLHRDFCGAFPDLQVTVDDVIAEGNTVAVRWHVTGTHRGNHLGFPASGRPVSMAGSSFFKVENGRFVDGWNQMDLATLIRRLQQP
jgi:steroid delta-isomerase-like uncharacterized protein